LSTFSNIVLLKVSPYQKPVSKAYKLKNTKDNNSPKIIFVLHLTTIYRIQDMEINLCLTI